ncbi:MAG TPA: DUF4097 family beta strand repeat-containing protein [Bryobacteraceae bacterium]|nr:DUF4097 family beta strand repeat-containing protein [Bryobacteraceae bacterium]
MRLWGLGAFSLAAACVLCGCIYVGDWGDSNAFREDFHSIRPFERGGNVSVESFNGSIEVAGWDQNSIEVNGTKHAALRRVLEELQVDVDSKPGSIHLRVRRPDPLHNAGIRFSIRVPRKTTLELVSTSNGGIDLDGLEGNARLHTSNGAIRARNLRGDLFVETSNGRIEAEEVSGNASLHTSNGAVRADASTGSFEASTSNGGINVRLRDTAMGSPIRLHSSNGRIELTLDSKQLPDVHASTSNSSIVVRLPASTNARVRAYTSHSPVSSEFSELQANHERHGSRSELDGTIGKGGPLLSLETTNGPIKILKE